MRKEDGGVMEVMAFVKGKEQKPFGSLRGLSLGIIAWR